MRRSFGPPSFHKPGVRVEGGHRRFDLGTVLVAVVGGRQPWLQVPVSREQPEGREYEACAPNRRRSNSNVFRSRALIGAREFKAGGRRTPRRPVPLCRRTPVSGQKRLPTQEQTGVTLALIHHVAGGFCRRRGGPLPARLDYLLHRPLSAILAIEDLSDSVRIGLVDLAGRLSSALADRDGLSWTRCHGDCHGYNAHIALKGPQAGQAVFFDFDESGPGYLAYDLAVFLCNCVLFGRKDHAVLARLH